jgi:carnitine 3-dehydrogenase
VNAIRHCAIRHCAILGGGVIGGGWAARFLLNGLEVTVFDPHPEAERRLREMVSLAGRAQAKLITAPRPAPGTLRFASSLAEAVQDADLIQESVPEIETLKRRLLAEIAAAAPAAALICSSTSGLPPTRLAEGMAHPERFLVAHPFNPVYLLPLVELCGGAATAPAAIERAAAFYASLGMRPLVVRKEIDGFIADRLLEALWREALWLVHDGVATVEEVDDAIRFGAGLRWAFMGTFLIYRLAGGEDGMRHFMEQFGPALKLPWTRLTEVPELTDDFLDTLSAQSDVQAAGRGLRALARTRDDCLVSIIQALKQHDFGAGAVLAAYEAQLRQAVKDETIKPLRLHEGSVPNEWIDYNNHMTESRYLQIFGDATDALLRMIGLDEAMLVAGFSYFTVETHLIHVREIRLGEGFYVTTQILAADDKRLHLFHRLHHQTDDRLLATAEQMLLHVDTRQHRACPAASDVRKAVARLCQTHQGIPFPAEAGRQVGMRRTGISSSW